MASKDQQVKQVVAGVALGVLARGTASVTSNKMTLEFAFDRAWDTWTGPRNYPSINGHDPGNLSWLGLQRSAGRHGVFAYWVSHRMRYPMLVQEHWTVEESLELHSDEVTSVDEWIELGKLFLHGFKANDMTPLG